MTTPIMGIDLPGFLFHADSEHPHQSPALGLEAHGDRVDLSIDAYENGTSLGPDAVRQAVDFLQSWLRTIETQHASQGES